MRRKIASGGMAAASVVGSTVVGMMWPTIMPAYGIPILILCGLVFVTAVAAFFWRKQSDSSDRNTGNFNQTHSGSGDNRMEF